MSFAVLQIQLIVIIIKIFNTSENEYVSNMFHLSESNIFRLFYRLFYLSIITKAESHEFSLKVEEIMKLTVFIRVFTFCYI